MNSRLQGHSLWLVPGEPAKSSFQDIIHRFSSEHKTPSFGPHATLIAGVKPEGGEAEVVSKTEKLALELKAISARVERAACKDLYFQSVSFLVAAPDRVRPPRDPSRSGRFPPSSVSERIEMMIKFINAKMLRITCYGIRTPPLHSRVVPVPHAHVCNIATRKIAFYPTPNYVPLSCAAYLAVLRSPLRMY